MKIAYITLFIICFAVAFGDFDKNLDDSHQKSFQVSRNSLADLPKYVLHSVEYDPTNNLSGFVTYFFYEHQINMQEFLFYIRDHVGSVSTGGIRSDYAYQYPFIGKNALTIYCNSLGCIAKLQKNNLA